MRFTVFSSVLTSLVLGTAVHAADHKVTIRNMAFEPATLTIAAGDTVTFTNADAAPHTATARDGSFDTGRLSRGQSARLRFTAAGTYDFFCEVHPSMRGSILAK